MTKETNFAALLESEIDADSGVIQGVSVITEGVARGHNVLIDRTTLQQIKKCADAFKGGVKVKMNHWSGVESIVGALRTFRIKGKKLLADLHLLKANTHREAILEMARELPDSFGLSVSFSGKDEEKEGLMYARCDELYSVDIVEQPAANPTGLFEQKVSSVNLNERKNDLMATENTPVTPPATPAVPSVDLSSVLTQLQQLSADVKALKAAAPQDPDKKPLSEMTAGELKNLVTAEFATQFSKVGITPGTAAPNPTAQPAPPAAPPPAKKEFSAIVAEKVTGGMKKSEAITWAIDNHPAEYAEARAKGIKL